VRAAVSWVRRTVRADPWGLLPPTRAYDNEKIEGRYTGHDLWAVCGVRLAAEMARALGESRDAADWEAFAREYETTLGRRLRQVTRTTGGAIPPGLDVPGGEPWGNLLAAVPCGVLGPRHPWVSATCAQMHQERYAEGLMTYKHGLHSYLTASVTETHVVRGEQEQALRDLYALLAHTGACHEAFERGVTPWADRDSGTSLSPHGWFAARYCLLLRDMLVREEGDDLHLFSVVSPAWAQAPMRGNSRRSEGPNASLRAAAGAASGPRFTSQPPRMRERPQVALRNAPTDFGMVSATMTFTATGADVTVAPRWRRAPRHVVVHLPYWARLSDWKADAPCERVVGPQAAGYAERDWPAWRTEAGGANEWLVAGPEVRRIRLRWERRPVEPLSYSGAVAALRAEYARRAGLYRRAGRAFLPIEAPPLRD